MAKAPGFYIYVGDYLKDTRGLTLEARGAWSDLLFFMWDSNPRGMISKTWAGYARLLSTTESIAKEAILELIKERICDVKLENQEIPERHILSHVTNSCIEVTLINRRMYRNAQEVKKSKLRMRKYRERKASKEARYADVANAYPSPSPLPSTNTKKKELEERKKWLSNSFEIFWQKHPGTKTGKKKCFAKWLVISPDQILFDKIMFAIEDQTTWRKTAKPNDFRPEWKNPLTWLNQECWNDETKQHVSPPPRYKEIKCPNPECGKMFKKNIDLNKNQCPHCYVIICKKMPPEEQKPDSRVEELTDKVVKSTQFLDDATETQH